MFRFIKQIFVSAMMLFGGNLSNVNSWKCVSMNNEECKVRPEIVIVNNDEPVFFPFNIKTSKCGGSCNNISDPYAKFCVPDVVKNMNVKVFNLMSRTNETRHVKWHGTCKCKCRLDARVYNSKQRRNNDKCRCECKELIDKAICDKGVIWNPSNCECECDKSCEVGAYLEYPNCKCRKRLIDKLIEECSENVDKVKMTKITLAEDENKCKSSLAICIGIDTYFIYYKYMNHSKKTASRYDYVYQAPNY